MSEETEQIEQPYDNFEDDDYYPFDDDDEDEWEDFCDHEWVDAGSYSYCPWCGATDV